MIQITELQKLILDVISAEPGIKYGAIANQLDLTAGTLSGTINSLVNRGVIRKDGKPKQTTYFATNVATVVVAPEVEIRDDPMPDKILDNLKVFTLTPEQLRYIRENKYLPRTELAKRLGISKLELNIGLERGMGK